MPRLLLDCDPGHDDALAILLAAKHSDLLGITTVSGNAPLTATTHNALLTLQIAGIEAPVYAGAARPLVAEAQHAPDIHGASGLGGPVLPELTQAAAGGDAVRFIVDTVRETDGVWLVAVGPLTNVALALREAPDIAARLAGISVMGGSAGFGNRTATAEFNIWADPEAAQVVFTSGVKLIMCGLNVTHQFMIYEDDVARIRALNNPVAEFAAELLSFYGQAYADAFFGRAEGPLHDPCAVLAVTHPDLLVTEPRHVEVELRGEHTRGMTVVDERGARASTKPNVQVAYRINREGALALLVETLGTYR
ncbi:MAG: Pyrimidine-specific ribonucleoside hydrolase RihB [uncultured Truepera sp.]|uniref:Pyrimidine-specific ribonucleoside hydrolase RihB n=1 Tax=uncultured Truepera sp. TaxID=543023 RepID=A0A6J4VLE3_9DEIN|nr:MAG: Pyrimidine-specific ribonucleoside hydrolase RihB [uncultured Truepera sp.]